MADDIRGHVRGVPLSAWSAKFRKVMRQIFLDRRPFQIFGAIIKLVPVYVVDGFLSLWIGVKGGANKSMDFPLHSSAFVRGVSPFGAVSRSNHNAHIAMNVKTAFQNSARATQAAESGSFISRVFRHPLPSFLFHKAGYAGVTRVKQGLN